MEDDLGSINNKKRLLSIFLQNFVTNWSLTLKIYISTCQYYGEYLIGTIDIKLERNEKGTVPEDAWMVHMQKDLVSR